MNSVTNIKIHNSQKPNNPYKILDKIARALEGLKYSKIVIVVHGGRVIFVGRYERNRVECKLFGLIKQSAKQKAMPAVIPHTVGYFI